MKDNQKYFTEDGVEITKRVENGKTLLFNCRRTAQADAQKKRSYHFEVYDGVGSKSKLIGFGVPK